MRPPKVVWRGTVASEGSGHQAAYYVRVFADGSGSCDCRDYYMRGLEQVGPGYVCKHLRRVLGERPELAALRNTTASAEAASRRVADADAGRPSSADGLALAPAELRRTGHRARGRPA